MLLLRRASFVFLIVLTVACMQAQSGDASASKPLYKVRVNTVFLKVSVTDPLNRSVTGLSKDDFRIYDEKVQQEISIFKQEPAPVSIGFLLDSSGSMKTNNNIAAARAALSHFLADANPGDEFFLMTFNQTTDLISGFTQDAGELLRAGALKKPSGRTALWDALYHGLDAMKAANNDRKALVIITDGEDNSSRYTAADVRDLARESDAQVYVVGEPGELDYGRSEIQNIAQLSGGRSFFPDSLNGLDYYIDLIHSELRNQYVIGYVPAAGQDSKNKWRKIQVKLDQPKGYPKLIVRAREGYYATIE
jgi:Ca-activated chloride channel homolog